MQKTHNKTGWSTVLYMGSETLCLFQVMVGDEEAFLEVKDQCGTWYQFMASWLLYTEPTVKSFDLSYHAHQCIAKFGGISRLKHSDLILLALMESDLHQVIFLNIELNIIY
jgi:hypothetical protein